VSTWTTEVGYAFAKESNLDIAAFNLSADSKLDGESSGRIFHRQAAAKSSPGLADLVAAFARLKVRGRKGPI
jgi:hypothetical protein